LVYQSPPESLAPIEFRHFVANTAAFARETNWCPAYTLSAGIDETIVALLAGTAAA
jgi:nucleoside-diphosphate-sugar epimerase